MQDNVASYSIEDIITFVRMFVYLGYNPNIPANFRAKCPNIIDLIEDEKNRSIYHILKDYILKDLIEVVDSYYDDGECL